ncbi:hypothetical protein [Pedobacter chitinilyticus]|uniref:Uncharacterized protein n=1 Tax=Pedobacter chitinilyticus TaxID=2233776 RepID=A0A451GD96_9SPHI|nr:hypothetical protein [Pedobacter chitinilyticus]RWU10828.1 hypothetical protein DPV69_05720 [Pedobacter chitinilyticus]
MGSFQRGWLDASFFIKPLNKHEKAFVVVGGSAYLIDLNTKEQLNTIEISEIKSAIVDETQRYIYYSNGYDLWFIDIYGVETCLFEYNQHEDFKLTGISNNKLYATCFLYTDNSKQFHIEIDLITKRVHKLDNDKQPVESKTTQNVIKAKPWWKLW